MVSAVLLLVLLAAAQATPESRRESFDAIDRRVDCHVAFFQQMGEERSADELSADYVFLFLRQAAGTGGEGRLLYIVSLSDGRSWIERGGVMQRAGDRWPDFSAIISLNRSWGQLTSDPSQEGRILYHAEEPHNHDLGVSVTEGACTLVPHAGGWRPQ